MNAKVKGRTAVNRYIKDFLEGEHFIHDKVEKTGKFVKQKDLFGLFDLIALHRFGHVYFIQVTCNRPHSHKKFLKFEETYGKKSRIIQAVWYDRKGWKIFEYVYGDVLIEDMRKKK